ncbi:P-loop containing nucleoside triphosphate hydrolase protein [Radiomyces spectabilis]|uniref:P-loop containing nucleoside triphosphate hydrolase protein n=1 Tax=Radiomyces spectabilis TaxID=64574 RepID=UPI00221E599C|nr:P-loop containing nucleoside triphosphate hydrolase protein [Radiomyces spectabilis]KAI8381418.1 P-loop containing nucleoside triphosphate hydrolase protein [Radiomyces spectabilis]
MTRSRIELADAVNFVTEPWPDASLDLYLMIHYMLLREELVGPLRLAINSYIFGKRSNDVTDAVIPGLRIFGTISSPTHTDPLIIFQVQSKMLSTMRHLVKEGALAMLMPEKTVDSDDHQRYLTSMSGKVIHAIVALISSEVNDTNLLSLPDTHLIALHVSPEELKKITWSTTYVMVVGHANANALLPVLSWLREQSLNVELSNISQSIAPRILFVTEDVKEKVISQADNSPYAVNEEDTVPDYLHLPLDLSTVMAPEYAGSRANPSLDDWPRLSEQELLLPPYQRPALYTLSPSQVDALKYALTHRIAVISGDIGTGKTYLASKLVELIYQGLVDSQCFHPVVVITRTEAGLDSILDRVIDTVPDLIRFGSPSEIQRLTERQGIHISVPNVNDPNRRQINSIEKNQAYTQAKLTALWNYRWRVQNGDPSVLVTSMPPSYAEALRSGYRQLVGRRDATASSDEVWSCWLNAEPVDAQRFNDQWRQAHQSLVTTMIDNKSCRLPDIMETQNYMSRQRWIEKHLPSINALGTATHWPLSQSRQGNAVRGDMTEAWSTIPSHSLWEQTPEQRRNIVQQVIRAMLQNIDKDIDDLLDQQFKASKTLEEARCQKLISTCRFGRVLGMTADFAAANRDFLAALWPKVLIVDEASEILESVIASSALGVRMEHLILLGNGDSDHKPKVWHDPLRGAPSHLDVSLFERWRQSGGEMVNLEEQWRMCEPVAAVFYALQRPSASAALDMEIDNRAEETKPGLLGLDHAVYFIDYAADPQARSINRHMSTFVGATVTEDNMDEARYVCHLALYMMQQSEKSPKLSILVFSPIQKRLLEAYLQYEMPHYSNFSSVVQTIVIHLVDDHVGKEDHVCIVSTAMPCGSSLPNHNMMLALTRARYGLYVVGQSSLMQKAGWDIFIDYMRENDLCSSSLRLRCQKHRKQLLQAGHWKHFAEAKNGGCQEICNTILDCGHVCKEACHHLPHSLLTCKKYCERPRFKGCTHSCPNKCFECEKRKQGCPPCRHQAVLTLPCGHTRSGPCYTLYTSEPAVCDVIVECALPCGHKRMVECHKATSPEAASSLRCSEIEFVTLDCTHVVQTTCGFRPLCTEPCSVTLECGHSCKQKVSCLRTLLWQSLSKGCRSADEHTDQCLETCQHRCFHGYKCGRYCWQVCSPCLQPCPNVCPHEQCTKKCYEACDRRPCNKSCTKTLPCSHKCSGLCGEPCPPCKKCQPHLQCSISLRTLAEFEENENIYMLPECGCVFSVESLDTYFVTQVKNGKHNAIRLWQCPACQTPIYTALRYNKYVKTEIELVNTIKSQQEKRRQLLTRSEKEGIIQAMNEETRSGRYSVVGGRWFVCENRHPYFIGDCGGATEISRCPQCDVLIGGVDHKVVESNRFYGEFDGCDKPAWPGQPGNQ